MATVFAMAQEKTIAIKDMRNATTPPVDTATMGYKPGDSYINRVSKLNSYWVHFIKPFEGKLKNYQTAIETKKDYDKATYKWLNDSIVSLTFINSVTQNKKSLKLKTSHGWCCGMDVIEGILVDEDCKKERMNNSK